MKNKVYQRVWWSFSVHLRSIKVKQPLFRIFSSCLVTFNSHGTLDWCLNRLVRRSDITRFSFTFEKLQSEQVLDLTLNVKLYLT